MSIILYFLNPNIIIFAHLSINEGSLFCFVVMRFIEPGCLRLCVLGVFGKRLTRAWFHDAWSSMNPNIIFAHLCINEGSLFCFVVMRFIEPGCFEIVFLVSLESA